MRRLKTKPVEMTIEERFAQTAPAFQADLASIADANVMKALDVYALWRKYAADCRAYDQSAILSEFLSWYRQQLPNVPEGMHRLG